MRTIFNSPSAKLSVAIAFGDETPELVRAAETLCQVSGLPLRLIHAVEVPFRVWASDPFGGILNPDVIEAAEEVVFTDGERRLSEVQRTVSSEIPVSHNVIFGRPAESIIADSIASRATLIITGTSRAGHKFVLKGFSTAFTLMADSPIPVLVIPSGLILDFSRPGLRILLADDLRDDREEARSAAFGLACVCPRSELLHVHVNTLSAQNLTTLFRNTLSSLPTAARHNISATELLTRAEEQLATKLEKLGNERRGLLEERGVRYQKSLINGDVVEALEQKITEWNPDVIVFGRHHMLHRRPLVSGHVPFRTMLSQRRTILVAPATR